MNFILKCTAAVVTVDQCCAKKTIKKHPLISHQVFGQPSRSKVKYRSRSGRNVSSAVPGEQLLISFGGPLEFGICGLEEDQSL